jgi:UDP-N-acetylmuramoyl-L-alanyl-D-glutamate--2,6-diaminopimelate ligase
VSTQFDQLKKPSPKTLDQLIELLRNSGAALPSIVKPDSSDLSNPVITGVAYDSRAVKPGDIFISIEGMKQDGNAFIAQAIQNGASCIVSEKSTGPYTAPLLLVPDARKAMASLASALYEKPSSKLRVLGVTGTNGKTTTTHLIEHILNFAGLKTGLIGTLGARLPIYEESNGKPVYKGKSQYLDVHHTTPQASDLQALLHTMASDGLSHVAMEVSSHALALNRVQDCNFASATLTNITQDHLDFHKTMDNYWRAKQLLFKMLQAPPGQKTTAAINLDDDLADEFIKTLNKDVELFTYGLSKEARIHPKEFHFDHKGTAVTLATPHGDIAFTTRLTGEFNLYNVMAAMAVALGEGISKEQVAESLRDFAGVSGRFEVVQAKTADSNSQNPLCIVDYAHTPDGLDNVLKAARALVPKEGKLIALFGCGGDRDSSKRPQMGEIAETLADRVVVTSDNPRSEDPQQIIADILAGIKRLKDVTVEVDRAKAIAMAVKMAQAGDVLVVAGKGHETYQILKDKTIDFDDRVEVAQALSTRI